MIQLYLSQSPEREDNKRKAAITVAFISLIYFLCNIGFLVTTGAIVFDVQAKWLDNIELGMILFLLIPLNSACNPVVYLIRKADMRAHVRGLWGRLTECLCGKG